MKSCVIMSVYKHDRLEFLQEALASLYNQTYKADIFIQLDGEVPDTITSYLEQQLDSHNIKYLGKRCDNLGLAASLNELLEQVKPTYQYIFRMDADDIAVPTRFEHQIDFLEKNPTIQAVGGWIEEFNVDTGERQIVQYGVSHQALKKNLMKRNPLAHVTICFRNTFFDTICCYDTTKLNEDFDLWIRAFKNDVQLHCLPEVLVKVRTSNAFFNRRKNFARAKEVMVLKLDATKTFGFGIKGYFYAVAHFVLFLSPGWIKRYLYKKLRN